MFPVSAEKLEVVSTEVRKVYQVAMVERFGARG